MTPASSPERETLLDAAMSVEAMTWDRTFPNEPTPTTRDLVVFAATAGHIKRRLRALATTDGPTHEPGDSHRYRIECEVCGERGVVSLSVEPQRVPVEPLNDRSREVLGLEISA